MSIGVTPGSGGVVAVREVGSENYNRLATEVKMFNLDFTIGSGWVAATTQPASSATTPIVRSTPHIHKQNLVAENGGGIRIIHMFALSGYKFTNQFPPLRGINILVSSGSLNTSTLNAYKSDDDFVSQGAKVKGIFKLANVTHSELPLSTTSIPTTRIYSLINTAPFSDLYSSGNNLDRNIVSQYNIRKRFPVFCDGGSKDLYFYMFEDVSNNWDPDLTAGNKLRVRVFYQEIFSENR